MWHVHVDILVAAGAEGTVYAGETFRLRIRFPANYPIEAPEVVFVPVSFSLFFAFGVGERQSDKSGKSVAAEIPGTE